MTKHVVNNSQVPHLWAHQAQDWAKGGGSISFEGRTIKSYWLAIGNIIKDKDGADVALVLAHSDYGPTTAKHISSACEAVRGVMPVYRVPYVGDGLWRYDMSSQHTRNVEWFLKEYRELLTKGKRGALGHKEWRKRDAVAAWERAQSYVERFGLEAEFPELDRNREPVEYHAALADYDAHWEAREAKANDPKLVAKRERAALAKAERDRRHYREGTGPWAFDGRRGYYGRADDFTEEDRAARAAAFEAANADRIAAWRNHNYQYLGRLPDGNALLRLSTDGKSIETSQGAVFPVEHGKLAFRLIAKVKATGEAWHTNGHTVHLGPYRIGEIDAAGNVRAGCHRVAWAEIEAIARQLGLLP